MTAAIACTCGHSAVVRIDTVDCCFFCRRPKAEPRDPSVRHAVGEMLRKTRGPAPVDAELKRIVTTDGVHGGVPVARSGRGGR